MTVRKKVGMGAQIERALAREKGTSVQRSLGFWLLWNSLGRPSADEMATRGVMSRRNAHYQFVDFKGTFGVAVHEWQPELAEWVGRMGAE